MKIAIITGGETGEREISIKTAESVKNTIDFAETKTFIFPEDEKDFFDNYKNFDLVIPAIHGVGGEDGLLQIKLNELKIPFIFSDDKSHSIAIDKTKTKNILSEFGIQSPVEVKIFPAFVKPRFGGSSVASKLCDSKEDFDNLQKGNPNIEFIKEEPIKGREFTVGVIEKGGRVFALPIVEIIPKGQFFDYESKYDESKLATEICPAEINDELTNKLKHQALIIHKELGIKHLSRSDFIVDSKNNILFLEVNTIPGITNTSLIPKMLKVANISFKDIIKEWCDEVLE